MEDNADFLEEVSAAEEEAKRPSPRNKRLSNPLDQVAATEARRAMDEEGKDRSMVGKQLRRSILIPPEMDEQINRLCKEYNVKKMEMLRYLIGRGIEDVHNGALEGKLVPRVTMELPTPEWKPQEP